jgi:hypothetical protein
MKQIKEWIITHLKYNNPVLINIILFFIGTSLLYFLSIFIIFLGGILNSIFLIDNKQIDPLAFMGTILIGIVSSYFIYQQNKISRISLEQQRPNIKITIPRNNEEENVNIPILEIHNEGNAEAKIVGIVYFKENDEKSYYHSQKRLFVNIQDSVFISLKNSNSKYFHSVLIFYKNMQSGRYYIYAKNLFFGTNEVLNISKSFIPIDTSRKQILPPLLEKKFYNILEEISINNYNKKWEKDLEKVIKSLI